LFELPMQFINGTTAFHAEFLIRLTCLYQFQDRALERHRPAKPEENLDDRWPETKGRIFFSVEMPYYLSID
jgi:hypothetical protein